MESDGATTAGELLLRSDDVERATMAIAAEVQAHLASAMQGPFGVAGAQAFGPPFGPVGQSPASLGADVLPQRFIGAGVALSVAYAALGEADGVRVAAGLRCAAAALFPNDDDGWMHVERAAAASIGHLDPITEPDAGDTARSEEHTSELQSH